MLQMLLKIWSYVYSRIKYKYEKNNIFLLFKYILLTFLIHSEIYILFNKIGNYLFLFYYY